jgi:hypothetical protein
LSRAFNSSFFSHKRDSKRRDINAPTRKKEKAKMITWTDKGFMGGWWLRMITFDAQNNMWCVGNDGNFAKWDPAGNKWIDQGGTWRLKMIVFVDGHLYGVGYDGNVGMWSGNQWNDLGFVGGWWLNMFSLDSNNMPWCVGNDLNAAKWGATIFGNWTLVPPSGSKPGFPGCWWLKWLSFSPHGRIYCVGNDGNLGSYDPDGDIMSDVDQNWELKMITWDGSGNLWCVGHDGNVGFSAA